MGKANNALRMLAIIRSKKKLHLNMICITQKIYIIKELK